MSEVGIQVIEVPWRAPVEMLAAFADEPFAFGLMGGEDGWSYVGRSPAQTLSLPVGSDAAGALRTLRGPPFDVPDGAPPFVGGVVGLAAYELCAVVEPSTRQARTAWPDVIAARYEAILAFDGAARRCFAVGLRAQDALAWLEAPSAPPPHIGGPLAASFVDLTGEQAYAAAVAQVVTAIERGDLFQANIARRWVGELARGAAPFDVFRRLTLDSAAPFAAYLRPPGRAVVSNSPERFLQASADGLVRTQPIKGTRPRGATPQQDTALAAELLASDKDRAENRMIVELMRNDLARACIPGSVTVEAEFALESYANVHHLVSTVAGRLARGYDALDLFVSAFPPGSVTGAPKVQAMLEIAKHEPPRGPYCGSMFWAGSDGAFDSSVLIRTVAFEEAPDGWRFEARAGAGIVANSDPLSEAAEAQVKLAALRRALTT
ncbi:aminodeoxychorismate synthase, component I [soil metagenome]